MGVISADKKTAIILFNLGGPDKPESVQPFLFNLFNDPAIISVPRLIRYFLARLISSRRAPVAKEIYAQLGGKSPILELTRQQSEALALQLSKHGQIKLFIIMRYWHPMSDEVAREVKEYQPDHIILLPLYPQYSTTTTGSSVKDWKRAAAALDITAPTTTICCYPQTHSFISAHAEAIRPFLAEARRHGIPRILFSAHGLPEKIINGGDPYQWQVEQTVEAVAKQLDAKDCEIITCYQSRVGPMKWIGPSTDDVIKQAGQDKRPVIVIPIAFVSEHSETLVELDIEYRHLADEAGVPSYQRVPALGINPGFIESLTQLCLNVESSQSICSNKGGRICPHHLRQCPQRIAA
jgi:ferrochelatase